MVKYTYDGVGNRVNMENDEGLTKYTYNELNQLVRQGDTTYEYDSRGNLIKEISPDGVVDYSIDLQLKVTPHLQIKLTP